MNFSKVKGAKFLFVSRGPGETGQARGLAKFLAKKGADIIFVVHQEKNLLFLEKDKEFKILLAENPVALKNIVEKEKPDVLLFFNSKMWGGDFLKEPGFEKPRICLGVDSNWLFNDKEYSPAYQTISWLDKYLVLFPEKIFGLGLKENNGDFSISDEELKKIIPVGFMPAYKKPKNKIIKEFRKKYNVEKDEKFIFSYFSGFGAGHRVFAFDNLVSAIDKLNEKGLPAQTGKKIKVLYLGPTEGLNPEKLNRPWLIKKQGLDGEEYFLTLASSDLVFQHQGMVTLAQAISSQVPVIANVSVLETEHLPLIHFWEVRPFDKAGACKMFSKDDSAEKISETIENLLYDKKSRKKMIKAQKSIFENGEKKAYKVIKKLLCAN